MNYFKFLGIVVVLSFYFTGCANTPNKVNHNEKSDNVKTMKNSITGLADTFIGKFWDTKNSRFINEEDLFNTLASKRIVYVGETHDNLYQHLAQLQVIKGIHDQGKNVAVGMEMFQIPYQPALDNFISGKTTTDEFLVESEYYKRWGFDYNLYKPILDYAKENEIDVVALNVPAEIKTDIGRKGLKGISKVDRALLPDEIVTTNQAHKDYVYSFFKRHGEMPAERFNKFYDVMCTWDETMADSTTNYAKKHPNKTVIVCAGSGHIQIGFNIPERAYRRLPEPYATIVCMSVPKDAVNFEFKPDELKDVANYIFFSKEKDKPTLQAPITGVKLAPNQNGLIVLDVIEGLPAYKAGVQKGDIITKINKFNVNSISSYQGALIKLEELNEPQCNLTVKRAGMSQKLIMYFPEKNSNE